MSLICTVLGCCGSYPGLGSACSSYLVRGAGVNIWVDAGSGSLANLQRHIDLAQLHAVVLSHEHPDHWQDAEGFAVASVHVRQLDPIPIFAPAGIEERMMAPTRAYDWHTVTDNDTVRVGGLDLRFSRTDHGPETLALRIDGEGRSLGYSADSGPAWSLEALGEGLDLALCEATYLKDREGSFQHMSARQAGNSARSAGVGRLVITHIQPTVDRAQSGREAAEAFGAGVTVAVEGMDLEV